jgi:patatin-related protein
MSDFSEQATPPAGPTTAAEPAITLPAPARPQRPELTRARDDGLDPRPSTRATQEIRLALAFTGGVSLAVWMGGVARELDLLVQASARRRIPDRDDPDPATPDTHPQRRSYRRLLDLVDAEVAVDNLAGTSAGGINAVVLGLANARKLDLSRLRDIWLRAGSFEALIRDPREVAPPSLLDGDGKVLAALAEGIRDHIVAGQGPPEEPRRTKVFVTTTLLSPEPGGLSDDYGTQIQDVDHLGLFEFDESVLSADSVVPALALAARSSASYPAAFEPSFVPVGNAAGPRHPDMSDSTDLTRSHWTADGGLLVNRPIAPLLQSVFDRGTDRQVRRLLLYVVPTSRPPDVRAPVDARARPLTLTEALSRDLSAVLEQSIAADVAAIREHNDRCGTMSEARLRLAGLGARLPEGAGLTDRATWADYRSRQGSWLVRPLVAEVSRQLAVLENSGAAMPPSWAAVPGSDRDARMRAVAREAVIRSWPDSPPEDDAAALDAAARLGVTAFDSAKATLLHLLRLGYLLATRRDERNELAAHGTSVHGALARSRKRVQDLVRSGLDAARDSSVPLDTAVERLSTEFTTTQGTPEELRVAWQALAAVVARATPLLTELTGHGRGEPTAPQDAGIPAAEPPTVARPTMLARRADAAKQMRCYLDYFGRGDLVRQLLELTVATRSMVPVLAEIEQPMELVQVSADTRTLLAPDRDAATEKLTGFQLHHFGAFYKDSWRVNDWMWGRLDGCGWLVHLLLDPRRIQSVLENDEVPRGGRAPAFAAALSRALDDVPVPADVLPDLAFLDDETAAVPVSLPDLAAWVAGVLQEHVAAEELPAVAAQIRRERRPTEAARSWLEEFDRSTLAGTGAAPPRAVLVRLTSTCPVASERLGDEAGRRTPLFLRTATRTAAVATSVVAGLLRPLTPLRPTLTVARLLTRAAHAVTARVVPRRPQTPEDDGGGR